MDPKTRRKLLSRYRVEKGKGFQLKDHDPGDTAGYDLGKPTATALLQEGVEYLSTMQEKLYAQDRWAVLCIFQAMDAAGKDSAIKHVFSGVNPQGCHVASFKAPGPVERDHDFLWRHVAALPARGMIGIHNRSWYEEVLVVRVHPEILTGQKLPEAVRSKHIWEERLADIAGFEGYLGRQGVKVVKFFLHLSPEEQRRRFLKRIEEPEKHWKFEAGDLAERRHWDAYQAAYEAAIRATATAEAPWYVVPADNKWFTRLVVAEALAATLEGLDLHYPKPGAAELAALAAARTALDENG
ncbi:polyphosphate kinase 2 family protein [Siccirubricoccus sp. KC 17139]|uniref:Polyphosphate kinase 2 family protein n=1 Tax=Siccirubricoccus soli TaxID=2899147 RepID=A0ABT1D490_9PROT|nr:polyphosphate kinase 2 family protein [Siccirubricoccus soli]MCO6416731.1 polyphosphate kinase 2 family protein [Siccirubricoccus soli]MCP2682866.1 polyphosphate kinase 2 family protein [Siccirubricoccus soli]